MNGPRVVAYRKIKQNVRDINYFHDSHACEPVLLETRPNGPDWNSVWTVEFCLCSIGVCKVQHSGTAISKVLANCSACTCV